MSETLDRSAIVAAFASRQGLELTAEEHEKLVEYVADVWDMADKLRDVPSPGLEDKRRELPLRAGYCNVAGGDLGDPRSESATGVGGVGRYSAAPVAESREARGDTGDPSREEIRAAEEYLDGSLTRIAAAIAGNELSPLAVVAAQCARIARWDGAVRSYINVDRAGALRAAAGLAEELAESGPRSPLHGIPFGAKDNIPAAGLPCTYNSPFMRDWRPQRDAEPIRRMRAAGAVLIGKHNLNEFGWSLPREDDLVAPPRNPWFPEEYSVGSSSGGGAAVAAGLAVAALGTDGGGSTRLPAAQHMLYGVKPGHGRVPSAGVSEGLVSEVGILTRRAEDAAAILSALLIDPDEGDAGARLRSEPAAWTRHVGTSPGSLSIAIPDGYLADVGMEPAVQAAFEQTCRSLEELGHRLVRLPHPTLGILHDAVRANFVVIAAEHYFDHEGPAEDRSRYGDSAGFYNLPGACLTAADYLHALRVGELTRNEIEGVLADVDLIITPTTPVVRTSTARNPKTHRRGGNAAYTAPFNISGHPALSFPAGISDEGMPIGMQFAGRMDSEFDLLRAARELVSLIDLPPFPGVSRLEQFAGSR